MPEQQSEGAQRPGRGGQPATADEPPPSTTSSVGHPSGPASGPVAVSVQAEAGVGTVDLAWIEGNLRRAVQCLAEAPVPTAPEPSRPTTSRGVPREIEVRIVGDVRMSELHGRHCGLHTTTDVLTFPGDLDADGRLGRVDIAVCRDEAARHAQEAGHAVERELLLYALHGVLHCLGYDDHAADDYARMHDEEDRLLEAIGVGSTFRTANGRSGRGDTGVPAGRGESGGSA